MPSETQPGPAGGASEGEPRGQGAAGRGQGGAGRPDAEGEDRITALARGPDSVFVYWRLGGAHSAAVAGELGGRAEWVLRSLNLSTGDSATTPVDEAAGSRYVEVRPGQSYGFELAVRAGGKWRTVCRSGRVEVPPAAPRGAPAGRLSPGVAGGAGPDPAAHEGGGVPGLRIETTPLDLGSSPVPDAAADSSE